MTIEDGESMKKKETVPALEPIERAINSGRRYLKTWLKMWGIFLLILTFLYAVGFFALVSPNTSSSPITQNEYTLAIGTGILSAFIVIMFQKTVLGK